MLSCLASLGGLPRVLPLEEQGMFYLGYYQQREATIEAAKANRQAMTEDDND